MKTQINPIKICIADDHELLRRGCMDMLNNRHDFIVTGEAANGKDLLDQIKNNIPDVILMDIMMPVLNGIEATRIITKEYPQVVVLTLSAFCNEYQIGEMLTAGAKGYVLKGATQAELVEAITTVYNNGTYFSRPVGERLASMIAYKAFDPVHNEFTVHLTNRETQVLRLICMQKSNKDISKLFCLSIRTVEDFRSRLLVKTRSENIAGLVVFAMQNGIFKPVDSDQ